MEKYTITHTSGHNEAERETVTIEIDVPLRPDISMQIAYTRVLIGDTWCYLDISRNDPIFTGFNLAHPPIFFGDEIARQIAKKDYLGQACDEDFIAKFIAALHSIDKLPEFSAVYAEMTNK
jgi:hypothetical protein